MGRRLKPRRSQSPPRFTQSQVQHMLKAFLDKKDALLDQSFYQKITEEINFACGHTGRKALCWRQVKRWHERHTAKDTSPSIISHGQAFLSDASLSNNTPESSSDTQKDAGERASDAAVLEFEARSSRDGAWYDVATFLEERVASSGELEVFVRYQGFSSEEDEWVNLKTAVRARSVPLESSECCKVAVGDVVLCFQENGDEAAYFDAHVLEIQRKLHDIRGCRCIFLIRYDHDQTEERVHLRRLCRRPCK